MTTSTPSTPGWLVVGGRDRRVRREKRRDVGVCHFGLTGLDGNSGVVHMAANVCKNLGLEFEPAYRLTVESGLLRGGG